MSPFLQMLSRQMTLYIWKNFQFRTGSLKFMTVSYFPSVTSGNHWRNHILILPILIRVEVESTFPSITTWPYHSWITVETSDYSLGTCLSYFTPGPSGRYWAYSVTISTFEPLIETSLNKREHAFYWFRERRTGLPAGKDNNRWYSTTGLQQKVS